MKRFLSIILIITIIFTLTACKTQDEESTATNEEIVESTEDTPKVEQNAKPDKVEDDKKPVNQPTKEQPDNEHQDTVEPVIKEETQVTTKPQESVKEEPKVPDYKSFSCKSPTDFKEVRFYNEAKKSAVQVALPSAWTLKANGGNSYDVISGGNKIGSISTVLPAEPAGKYDSSNNYDKDKKIFTFTDVYWYKDGNSDRMERYFQFVCDESNFTINMNVNYTELNDTAVNKIKQSALSVIEQPNVSLEGFEKANGSKKILIIGNSFIGTSQVGAFLSNMLTGSGYSVEAISRGHATVKTYAEDSALMSRIKNGEFAYVFQCGFYATENAAALETVKNSCAASDTNLVIFPAHNESEGTINAAKLQYTDAYFIDWRSEITTLINGGVDRWDMCKDDQYKHSTPLAGYVGAHMIYSNLFKKVPPAITGGAPLTMDEIKAKLGDYPERSVSLIHQSTQIVEFTGTEYKIA